MTWRDTIWPKCGTIDTYGVFYGAALLAHAAICWWIARRSHLQRRIWIAVAISFVVSMTVIARVLYDVLRRLPLGPADLLSLA